MASITKHFGFRHLRANPTRHILHLRKGTLVHDGSGLSFWFRPLTAALSEVPLDDREQPLLFHARTADFQDVTVQASITYRIAQPGVAAGRFDFGIDLDQGAWIGTPLEQIGGLLTELAQQHAVTVVAEAPLPQVLADGTIRIRESIADGLGADARLAELGIAIADVRVVAVRADPDLERALMTPAREQVQQAADAATFERRAVAVERERAIAENELQNQIELARRQAQLVEQHGANERRRAVEQTAADRIQAEGRADTQRLLAESQATATRAIGAADAEAETARLAAYRTVDATILLALAAKELAGHLPAIGTVNLTPDLLTPLLGRLTMDRS